MTKRTRRRWLLLAGILFMFLCLGGMAYLITSFPLLGSTAVSNPPIIWRSLPTPSVTHPDFISYSNTEKVNAIVQRDGLLWAASDGGLLVWQESNPSQIVKFASEHGLAENRTTSAAVGNDGSIWVGTAAAGVSQYNGVTWQTFTSEDGLPSNNVRDLAVGADGTIWVATSEGIGRYDGRRWFSYTRSRTLLQLPSNNVSSLAVGPNGLTIYAGTAEGVVQFNGRSWESLAQVGSEAVNTVQDVAVSPDGRLWATSQAGLSIYDGSRWQLFTTADGLASEDVRTVTANADGRVWLGYGEQGLGLTRFDLSNGIPMATAVSSPNDQIFVIYANGSDLWLGSAAGLLRQDAAGEWQTITPPSDIPANELVDLLVANGQPWLGSASGVSRFNGTNWEGVDGLPETPALSKVAVAVSSLNQDSSGQIWATFASVGQGAAIFNPNGDSWQTVSCPVSGPASPNVRQIMQTADGLLWFATEAGVATFDTQTQRWNLLTEENGLPSSQIRALALHPDSTVWVGTSAGLAVSVNGRFTTQLSDDIRELAIGPNGTVWFITSDAVWRIRGDQTEILRSPPVSQVYDVLATAEGFWLAADEGVAFFNGAQGANGRWVRFSSGTELPGNRATALGVAADGTVWASSENLPDGPGLSSGRYGSYTIPHNYLSFFNGQHWQATLRPAVNGLIHPIITSVVTVADGDVWLASLGGISRFDGESWQNFTTLDGLPADEVYELLTVGNAIWAVTKEGIIQFNPASQSWKSFAAVGDWSNYESAHLATDGHGTVWAGSGTELHRYNGQSWQPIAIDLPDPDVNVRDFVVDADGRLILTAHLQTPSTEQHFLAEFDGQTWTWHEVTLPSNGQSSPFSRLWLAPNGRLWASNENSLWRFNLPDGNFNQPSQYPELIRAITDMTFLPNGKPVVATRFASAPLLLEPDGAIPLEQPLAATDLFAVHADENGRLWLGSNRGAARQLDDGTWQAIPLTEAELAETTSTLTVQLDGNLLLGGTFGTILRWDGEATAIVSNATGGDAAPISSLFTAADGTLWRSSFGSSVARLDGNRWLPYPANPPIYNERVWEAAVSDPTTLWLATAENLVSITTVGERTVCQLVTDQFPAAAGLTADFSGQLWFVSERIVQRGNAAGFEVLGTLALPVTAVAPDGTTWYVTQTDVVRVQGNQRLPIAYGLAYDTITALAIAPDGAVWLGTTAGIVVLQGGQSRMITAADGLAGNQITHLAIAADGSAWVGTLGGVSWIRP
ncbi:two-component regulator propeller domain-containing protein [Candidatus Leptofilum sp.]|uniref:two-component regulator propeller domain-containing protein n=1 Tax=Candidatus Leptofilum sp. TaxID=3241576 RepID=UPI003B598600